MGAGHDDARLALLHRVSRAAARFEVDKLFCYSASTASDVVLLLAFKWVQTLPHLLCMVVTVVGPYPQHLCCLSGQV